MEAVRGISDWFINAMAVGFVVIMIAGLALNSNKIKKIEDKLNGK